MTYRARRYLCTCVLLSGFHTQSAAAQGHTSEFPASQAPAPVTRTIPTNDKPQAPIHSSAGNLAYAHVFTVDQMPVGRMTNGGESRDIVRGTLPTGEAISLHESTQPAGVAPNPPHVIHHSEFILILEGSVEFQHESDGKMVAEKAGPGDAIYVATGTMHTLRNIGSTPAKYTVVAIGGDAK